MHTAATMGEVPTYPPMTVPTYRHMHTVPTYRHMHTVLPVLSQLDMGVHRSLQSICRHLVGLQQTSIQLTIGRR